MARGDSRGVGNRHYTRLQGPSPGDAIFNRDHYGERAGAAMGRHMQSLAALVAPTAGPQITVRRPNMMNQASQYLAQTQLAQPQTVDNPNVGPPSLYDPRNIIRNLIGHLY